MGEYLLSPLVSAPSSFIPLVPGKVSSTLSPLPTPPTLPPLTHPSQLPPLKGLPSNKSPSKLEPSSKQKLSDSSFDSETESDWEVELKAKKLTSSSNQTDSGLGTITTDHVTMETTPDKQKVGKTTSSSVDMEVSRKASSCVDPRGSTCVDSKSSAMIASIPSDLPLRPVSSSPSRLIGQLAPLKVSHHPSLGENTLERIDSFSRASTSEPVLPSTEEGPVQTPPKKMSFAATKPPPSSKRTSPIDKKNDSSVISPSKEETVKAVVGSPASPIKTLLGDKEDTSTTSPTDNSDESVARSLLPTEKATFTSQEEAPVIIPTNEEFAEPLSKPSLKKIASPFIKEQLLPSPKKHSKENLPFTNKNTVSNIQEPPEPLAPSLPALTKIPPLFVSVSKELPLATASKEVSSFINKKKLPANEEKAPANEEEAPVISPTNEIPIQPSNKSLPEELSELSELGEAANNDNDVDNEHSFLLEPTNDVTPPFTSSSKDQPTFEPSPFHSTPVESKPTVTITGPLEKTTSTSYKATPISQNTSPRTTPNISGIFEEEVIESEESDLSLVGGPTHTPHTHTGHPLTLAQLQHSPSEQ